MPGFPTPASRRRASVGLVALAALAAAACGAKHRLADYDFRGRTLTLITIAPPHPEVLSGASYDVDPDNPLESLIRVGSEIVREAEAEKLRARLDSAAANVDVSGRMAERALANAARQLRANPVPDAPAADYELEIRVRRYGIVASSWTAGAHFAFDADVFLLDGRTGRRIWDTRVRQREPIRTSQVGVGADASVGNVVTAIALARMSAAEIEKALESLADYAADRVVERLGDALDDVRR